MSRRFLSLAIACAIVGIPAAATADDKVVVEAYGGQRPADAEQLLAPIYKELHDRGYVTASSLGKRVAVRVSKSGDGLASTEVDKARKFKDSAYSRYINGDDKLAVSEAQQCIDILERAPAHMARKPDVRDIYFDALIIAAHSHMRLGNSQESTDAMSEIIRTFSDRSINSTRWDPDIIKLQSTIKADLAPEVGTLRIEVSDPKTVLYVNERYVGAGDKEYTDLVPGKYRIYAEPAGEQGRVHTVNVSTGSITPLRIDSTLDTALRTRGDYVGLELDGESGRADDESPVVTSLARDLNASQVVVLGIRTVDGKRSITGVVYDINTGDVLHSAGVSIDPIVPSDDKIASLGRFLAGDEVEGLAPLVFDNGNGTGSNPRFDDTGNGGARFGKLKWMMLGLGVAGMATGGVLIAIHEPEFNEDGSRNDSQLNTKVPGIATLAAGAVFTGVAIYMFMSGGNKSSREPAVSIAPTDGGFGLSLSGSF